MGRSSFAGGVWLAFALGAAAPACVLSAPSDEGKPGPCGGRACSALAYCERGTDQCRCEPGLVGNPYVAFGCQEGEPEEQCAAPCGLNAYCEDAACVCVEGFAAVCGTGDCLEESRLCDGTADCSNGADEQVDVCYETVVMEWLVSDDCDDASHVGWRLWATDRDWVWPSVDTVFTTHGLGQLTAESIECFEGEIVCFGGSAGDRDWGVGLSGTVACDDCCETCRAESIDYGALRCQ